MGASEEYIRPDIDHRGSLQGSSKLLFHDLADEHLQQRLCSAPVSMHDSSSILFYDNICGKI